MPDFHSPNDGQLDRFHALAIAISITINTDMQGLFFVILFQSGMIDQTGQGSSVSIKHKDLTFYFFESLKFLKIAGQW